jgi:hypothetical protein
MANRRMFSQTIIDSDDFLDMPLSTQSLYFHLAMRADDEGFINNPKKICRMIGAGQDELKILIGKRFLLHFNSGVVVIKHWLIHNMIRKDRMKETLHSEEKAQLTIKDNGIYTDSPIPVAIPDVAECQPVDNQLSAQVSIGKVRLGEVSNNIEHLDDAHEEALKLNKSFDEKMLKEKILDHFEACWKLYPVKKGKDKITLPDKKELFKYSQEQIQTCINNLVKEYPDKQYQMHGRRFFKGDFKDYLESDYKPSVSVVKKNSFNQIDERKKDNDYITAMLAKKSKAMR